MSSSKRPQPKPVKVRPARGGWQHPLALLLLIVAAAWAVGAFFATSAKDFPKVGTIPVLSGLGGWNWGIAIVLAFIATSIADRTRPPLAPGTSRGWRYAGVAMSVSALLGLLWVVVFYVISNTSVHIPVYSDLGQWNILIGMGFIIAAFGFATKWE
ncbi:MAG: cell division protein CrgA [Aeromicrobium sp.]